MHRTSFASYTRIGIYGALCAVLGFFPFYSDAQWNIPSAIPLELTAEPALPRPNTPVSMSINAYAIETAGARITWYQDGVEIPGTRDQQEIDISAGDIGKSTTISATVAPVNAAPFTLKKKLTPAAVDLVVEANTHTPSFYKGRALPSAESLVRVIAIPHTGLNTDPSTLSYLWEFNGSTQFGGAIRGRQSIFLNVPRYMGGTVRVIVNDASGNTVAQSTIELIAMQPQVHFYEENPLRGLSDLAVSSNLSLIGDETTVHAEPYFINLDAGKKDQGIIYEWGINGERVDNGNEDPSIITLRKTGGSGTAAISARVYTTESIPQLADRQFRINF